MKKLLLLFMVLGLLVSGCPGPGDNWVRKDTSSEQLQLDYQSCTGRHFSVYIKDDITQNKLEEDFNFCAKASKDRERHKDVVANSLTGASLIPYAGVFGCYPKYCN